MEKIVIETPILFKAKTQLLMNRESWTICIFNIFGLILSMNFKIRNSIVLSSEQLYE